MDQASHSRCPECSVVVAAFNDLQSLFLLNSKMEERPTFANRDHYVGLHCLPLRINYADVHKLQLTGNICFMSKYVRRTRSFFQHIQVDVRMCTKNKSFLLHVLISRYLLAYVKCVVNVKAYVDIILCILLCSLSNIYLIYQSLSM